MVCTICVKTNFPVILKKRVMNHYGGMNLFHGHNFPSIAMNLYGIGNNCFSSDKAFSRKLIKHGMVVNGHPKIFRWESSN